MSGRGLDPAAVRALVRARLGAEPTSVVRMPYGHFNVTYDVGLADGRHLIVRTNRDPAAMRGVRHNLPILARLGLPVPRLVDGGDGWLILEKIPGRDLLYELETMSPAQMTRLAGQIVAFQRLAAAGLPPAPGHGWRPIGEPGRFPTWADAVEDALASLLPRVSDRLPAGVAARLRDRLDALRPGLALLPPTPFLDDLTTKNVIVERGELRGLVDFDVVCYGDPRYWLGLTRTAVLCHRPAAAFYAEELQRLWGADEADRAVVRFYSALFGLDFIAYGGDGLGGAELDRLLALAAAG